MESNNLLNTTQRFTETEQMPVLFLGHGTPMNAIGENEFAIAWRRIGKLLPKPAAILCISAHWETRGTFVTAMERPETIHDFGGFPKELYAVNYPAPGDPELALKTKELITNYEVGLDQKWGLDHGCWSVVRQMYPAADVPVVQLSLDYTQGSHDHYELAKELALLRQKGVLIIGSGNIVHNLRMVDYEKLDDSEYGYDWAIEANEKMKSFILSDDHQSLIDYTSQGKAFHLSVPTPEHFLPLLYVLALKGGKDKVSLFNDKIVAGSLSMTSVLIENVKS